MDKSKFYLNLTMCTEEERKSLPQIIKKANEYIYEMSEKMLNSGLLIDEDGDDSYILLSKSLENEWIAYLKSGCDDKTELTYPEFIKLFEGGESIKSDQTQLEKLEADKAELLEALEIFIEQNTPTFTSHDYEFPEHVMKAKSLIQKHKQ